jgi:hypothetical protein
MSDNFPIKLQENIPLADKDWQHIEEKQAAMKIIPKITAWATILTMGFIAFLMRDNLVKFKYYEHILFIAAGFALYFLAYSCGWFIIRYDNNNLKKDIAHGKNKLTSVLIKKDKNEYGEFLTFAGTGDKEKIRLCVKQEWYKLYPIGTKLQVTYFKFSRQVLELVEIA